MGLDSGNRKANNRGGSNVATGTDSWADVVVEGVPMVNGSSGPFITKVTEVWRFRNSWPCNSFFVLCAVIFSPHQAWMTIWVHLVRKDHWVFAGLRPEIWCPLCLHVELPNTVSIFIDRHYWLYFFCSVRSNNLIHLKWCEAIISYTLTHQFNWHFQALLYWVTLVGGRILVALNVTVEIIVVQVIQYFKPI